MSEMSAIEPTVVIPPAPRSTHELEAEADAAIGYLGRFTQNSNLDPELRMAMNDIKNTIKTLKHNLVRMGEEGTANHEKLVEIIRSQRII